jgi:hypothetical protein
VRRRDRNALMVIAAGFIVISIVFLVIVFMAGSSCVFDKVC